MKSDRKVKPSNVMDGMPQSPKSGSPYDYLPRGYAGAKLARKAMQKAVAVKHPRGLRLNGTTVC